MRLRKHFQKFLDSNYSDQFFLLIVLIGLLPVMADYSLFSILGGSILDLFDEHQIKGFRSIIYYLPMVLLPIGIAIVFFKKEPIDLIGLIPSLIPVFVFLFLQELKEGSLFLTTSIDVIHLVAHKLAFFYFIFNGHIRSAVFGVFSLLVLVLLGWQMLILFFLFTALMRFLYLAILQNVQIFSKIGLKKTIQLAFKTFLYWSPMLLFIIPGEILSEKLYKSSIDALYQNTFVESTNEEEKYERDQFEKDLQTSLDIEISKINKKFTAETKAAFKKAGKKIKDMPSMADKIFENGVPSDLPDISEKFELENCPIWRIKCTVKDITKEGMNDAFVDGRKDQKKEFRQEVVEMQGKLKKTADLEKFALTQVNTQTENMKTVIYTSLMLLFKSILFFNIISTLILGFLILKSFLYVFARVAFTADNEAYVTLLDEEMDMPIGNLNKCGHTYTIPSDLQQNFYISRVFEPSGRAPKFTIPQWTKAVVGRINAKAYAMNKLTMKGREGDVHFRAMGGNEFVEWEIKEGEIVIFDFKRFVGMSEGIQLSAVVSLRLTSLLMGKIIFTVAKGPGKLVLMTEGKPIVGSEEKANASIATSRIVAWQKNSRFHVESELNVMDVFMSGIYLKRQGTDPVLIDADAKGRSKKGIVSFIRKFLMPF